MKFTKFVNICIALVSVMMISSCVPTVWSEPFVEEKEDFHNLIIRPQGETFIVPFEVRYYYTKWSGLEMSHPIRSRIFINDVSGEIYDTCLTDSPVRWGVPQFKYGEEIQKAEFYIDIPVNDALHSRTVSVQVSIDNIAHSSCLISGSDEHDWGEWITILDGIQEGW